jgi:Flp pilus assembly protein TadD
MRTPTVLDDTPAFESDARGPHHAVDPRASPRHWALGPPERVIPWGIVLLVVAVFAIGLRNEFVQWDDQVNLVENVKYRGLGSAQLAWMFTTTLMGHYIPVTWLSFGLDYVLWGMQPAGYHFTNLVLHAANAALVYWLAKRLLAAARPGADEIALRAGAAVTTLFFAIHPLRAESVAWATERRDLLSGLFFFACILLYLRAASSSAARRRGWLALAVLSFTLSIFSKAIVMTLPLLLIILDWYPLRRLSLAPATWRSREALAVWLEKLPFFVVAGIGAAVSYWAVNSNEFFTPSSKYPLPSRIAMAFYSVTFYASKTVLPIDLSPLYELPSRVDPLEPQFVLAMISVTLVTMMLIALAARWPAGLAAFAWYAIILAPVGGLVHAGFQLAHDRYSYLSCLSWALLVGGGVISLLRAGAAGTLQPAFIRVTAAALGLWLVTLAALTWQQVQVWRDTESLWTHATFATPECSICHDNYGALIVNRAIKRPGEELIAVSHFHQALALKPDRDKPYGGLGLALIQLQRPAQAEAPLRRAVASFPRDVGPLNNLGMALNQQGRFAEAVPYLRRALVLDERNVTARANLGGALAGLGRLDEAIEEFHRAAAQDPYAEEPRIGLVLAYREAGNVTETRKHLTILRQLHRATAQNITTRYGL